MLRIGYLCGYGQAGLFFDCLQPLKPYRTDSFKRVGAGAGLPDTCSEEVCSASLGQLPGGLSSVFINIFFRMVCD